jgi:large subunit ribosomal protein L15e
LYSQIGKTWQKIFHEKAGDILSRAIQLRRSPTIVRLERPSRLDRARMLGYKAKQGVIVIRIKVSRGGMRRQRPTSGRRSKHLGVLRMKAAVSMQEVAERRVSKKYPNMKVLGSYILWSDGKWSWYECILVDPYHPSIKKDYNYKRMAVTQVRS